MATTGLSYSELSTDAKEVALNSFINFYVDQYRKGSKMKTKYSHI